MENNSSFLLQEEKSLSSSHGFCHSNRPQCKTDMKKAEELKDHVGDTENNHGALLTIA